MSTTFVAIPAVEKNSRKVTPDQQMEIIVNIKATVLDAEVVRRKANVWLLDHVGNIVGASKPELILGERLVWRYDVVLGVPNLAQPGSGALYKVGQMMLDAQTGDVLDAEGLVEELQANASAIAR